MSFLIGGDGEVIEVDYLDIERALCGECEKPLKWGNDRNADCCGFRYTYWTSTLHAHRVPVAPRPSQPEAKEGRHGP